MLFSENRETFSRIAALYYLAEITQDEIAKIFGISRFKVSRVLKRCRAMKVVEFKINKSPEYLTNLEREITDRLGISSATVVQSGSTLQESKANVAKMAAKHLERAICDGMKIGLSWGSTIQQMVRYYNKQEYYPNTLFVQLSGSLCSRPILEDGYIDGNIFLQQFASKAHSGWSVFMVPYVVNNPALKELLYEEPQIKKHVELFKKLDMAIVELGSDDPSKSVSYLSGYLTYEETKKLADDGLGADVCGTRLTVNGEIRETILKNRVLTIEPADLQMLENVCAIGAGTEKVISFIAGCRSGIIKSAIMDEVCAISILSKH